MTCKCITEFDALLREKNGRLSVTFSLPRDGTSMQVFPRIAVEKIVPRGKSPPLAIPTFCPFCGVKYEPVSGQSTATEARPA